MSYEFADHLIELRRTKGMSQEELAGTLGISRQAVSKWERAESAPDIGNLVALASLYDVSLDELVRGRVELEEQAVEETEPEPDAADDGTADADAADDDAIEAATAPSDVAGETALSTHSDSAAGAVATGTAAGADAPPNPADEAAAGQARAAIAPSAARATASQAAPSETPSPAYQHAYEVADEAATRTAAQPETAQAAAAADAPASHAAAEPTTANTAPAAQPSAPEPTTATQHRPSRAWRIFPYPLLCVIIYLFLGFFMGLWHPGWVIFFTIPFYYWVVSIILHDPNYIAEHGGRK